MSSTTDADSDELARLREENRTLKRSLDQEREKRELFEGYTKIHPETGLPNYGEFYKELERLTEPGSNGEPRNFCVAMLRLDNDYQRIKNSKDRSKALLLRTTIRIREVIGDTLYQSDRLDEFYVIVRSPASLDFLARLFLAIIREVAKPQDAPAEGLSFSCHIGFAESPLHGTRSSELMNNAEIALRYATQKNKRVVRFAKSLGLAYHRITILEQELRMATQNGFKDFFMVYQPFVDQQGVIKGCESLIRWKHPELGMIAPPQFIPIAERTGDIRILGRWIMYRSVVQLKEWHKQGFLDLFVSVNLSPIQFNEKELVQNIAEMLAALKIEGRFVKLEITEGAIMSDPNLAVVKLLQLKDLGIRLSIDDFGTGYSSLNYLRKLPIDTLKIDKSFIDDLADNVQNQEIVRAIISMARSLHIETLAEGVETAQQRDILNSEGCQYIQGYFYSKPVDPDLFSDYLRHGAVLPYDPSRS